MVWGDKWYATVEGPPLYLTHKPCNNSLKSRMTCSECGEDISMTDIEFELVEILFLTETKAFITKKHTLPTSDNVCSIKLNYLNILVFVS